MNINSRKKDIKEKRKKVTLLKRMLWSVMYLPSFSNQIYIFFKLKFGQNNVNIKYKMIVLWYLI